MKFTWMDVLMTTILLLEGNQQYTLEAIKAFQAAILLFAYNQQS